MAVATPLSVVLPPLLALLLVVAIMAALVTVEAIRYAVVRDELRQVQV